MGQQLLVEKVTCQLGIVMLSACVCLPQFLLELLIIFLLLGIDVTSLHKMWLLIGMLVVGG